VTLRIGTRRSRLALAQATEVGERLQANGVDAEIVGMTTSGDRETRVMGPAGLKGMFVAEIVRALRDGRVDLAVHSAKDLPAEDEEGLVLGAVPERASPLDVLVTRDGNLAPGSVIGTSSLRRQAQIFRWRPDVLLRDLRGNVDTRLRKLADGEIDAIVLAAAGLVRLGIVPEHAAPMSVSEVIPAPGQGCLAIQARADDASTLEALSALDHARTRTALRAGRSVAPARRRLRAARRARGRRGRTIRMVAGVFTPDGAREARTAVEAGDPRGGRPRRGRPARRGRGGDHSRRSGREDGSRVTTTKSLAGKTILITRPREQSRCWCGRSSDGARPPSWRRRSSSCRRGRRRCESVLELADGAYEVDHAHQPAHRRCSSRTWSREVRARVAAIGEGTSEAFRSWARRDPDLVPRTYTTLGLARALPRGDGRVLCPRADIAPEGLEDALARKGWRPERVEAYRTRLARSLPRDARDALHRGGVDAVTFTSASTVRGFVGALGAAKGHPKVVCIGPITAREAREHGFTVSAVASPHTMEGLVAALERVLRPRAA
jgi:hydroxymethylbilane synthase